MVTLEDVLEVLTGEIVDETDTCPDMQVEAMQRIKHKYAIPPKTPVS